MTAFDTRGTTDNRAYDYAGHREIWRAEYDVIERWIPASSRVLDLGCGNGSLLAALKRSKQVEELGIDSSESGIAQCREKGLRARVGRIDVPLDDVAADSFDVAVCNVTLQMVMYPEVLLREMKRVAPVQIVSFANFAFVKNRIAFLLHGRMPRPMLFGYSWYDTGHIHQLSLLDFRDLCAEVGLRVVEVIGTPRRRPVLDWLGQALPNLFASVPIVRTVRDA